MTRKRTNAVAKRIAPPTSPARKRQKQQRGNEDPAGANRLDASDKRQRRVRGRQQEQLLDATHQQAQTHAPQQLPLNPNVVVVESPPTVPREEGTSMISREENVSRSDAFLAMTEAFTEAMRAAVREATSESGSRAGDSAVLQALPIFDGNPLNWVPFKDAYLATHDANDNRKNVSRLNAALKGSARDEVDMLFASGGDAEAIMETLEFTFGGPETVTTAVIENLKRLPNLCEYGSNLTQFATKLRNSVVALRSLGKQAKLADENLLNDVVKKIPSTLIIMYNDSVALLSSDETKLERLADFLFTKAKAARAANGVIHVQATFQEPRDKSCARASGTGRHARQTKPTLICASVDEEARDAEEMRGEQKCVHCRRESHSICDCKEFRKLPNNSKWKIVKQNKLCFSCLEEGHRSRDCENKKPCSICNRSHHKLLHYEKRGGPQPAHRDGEDDRREIDRETRERTPRERDTEDKRGQP